MLIETINVIEFCMKAFLFWKIICLIFFLHSIYRTAMDNLDKVLSEHGIKKLDEPKTEHDQDQTAERRKNLIELCQCGILQKIGIKKSESQLISAKDSKIDELFIEFQNRYTACVTDSLTENILFGYAKVCNYFYPKINDGQLARELSNNFIINAELKKKIGYFGIFLSPWLALSSLAVLTAKSAVQSDPEQSPQNDMTLTDSSSASHLDETELTSV